MFYITYISKELNKVHHKNIDCIKDSMVQTIKNKNNIKNDSLKR